MSDTRLEQTKSTEPSGTGAAESGEVRLDETIASTSVVTPVATAEFEAKIGAPRQVQSNRGTVEHLAARRPVTPVDTTSAEIKERLSDLQSTITRIVTGFRWGGLSLEESTERIIPLLNVGSIYQWPPVLVPLILEIDRAGDFIPVWLNVIEQQDPTDLPADSDPAETMVGRARRIAILMLGNYKTVTNPDESRPLGFSKQNKSKRSLKSAAKTQDLAPFLGKLSGDPNTSLYATQSLVKQGTTSALQALISALKDAEGWAKVDVVEACLTLEQPRFYEIVVARGTVQDARILEPVYACLPMMNDVERWMNGPGRDVLLETLSGSEEEAFIPTVKVLGEMREPRAISILINQLSKTTSISNREQAIRLVHMCETLGRLNDRRAVQPLMQLIGRVVDVEGRAARPRRRDNLPFDDKDIPGSIVYA